MLAEDAIKAAIKDLQDKGALGKQPEDAQATAWWDAFIPCPLQRSCDRPTPIGQMELDRDAGGSSETWRDGEMTGHKGSDGGK